MVITARLSRLFRLRRWLVPIRARACERRGKWQRAGELHQIAGNIDRAIACYEKAGDYQRCAAICLEHGRLIGAGGWIARTGDLRRAAACFLAAGRPARAAELYLRQGAFAEAGCAFEKAGRYERAAECFEREQLDSGAPSLDLSAGEKEARLYSALRAAECFQKAGQPERALHALEASGHPELAASLAEAQGDWRSAGLLYQKTGDLSKAAALLRRAGDARAALRVEAERHLANRRPGRAAQCWLKAGDPLRAAELFEELGRFRLAADCYAMGESYRRAAAAALRAGEPQRAALFFEKNHELDRAAELHRQNGNPRRAAELLARLGMFFEAARAAWEAQQEALMIDYLQRVPASDARFGAATLVLAKTWARRGRPGMAIARLEKLLSQRLANAEHWNFLAHLQQAAREKCSSPA